MANESSGQEEDLNEKRANNMTVGVFPVTQSVTGTIR
jgi:hypothetical protein